MKRAAAALATALLVSGCATTAFDGDGWRRSDLPAAGRLLASASNGGTGEILTVVIEGDGAAHDARGRPARDPTPRDPTGLAIARAWPSGPAAWLGRLCQYVRRADLACVPSDWSEDRFSPAAMAAADAAIDQLKAHAHASRVRLVGWSGGGVLAAALAQSRTDVAGLVTIAAPLDLAAWTAWHRASPVSSPLVLRETPAPQFHLFGGKDTVTPPAIGLEASRRLAGDHGAAEVWSEGHACCWAARTPQIAAGLAAFEAARSGLGAPPPGPPRPGSTH